MLIALRRRNNWPEIIIYEKQSTNVKCLMHHHLQSLAVLVFHPPQPIVRWKQFLTTIFFFFYALNKRNEGKLCSLFTNLFHLAAFCSQAGVCQKQKRKTARN